MIHAFLVEHVRRMTMSVKHVFYPTIKGSNLTIIFLLSRFYLSLGFSSVARTMEIKNHSAIPESELSNGMLYLCNPKTKILTKENMKQPKFAPNEKVGVNLEFSNPNIKVQLLPVQTHKKKELNDPKDNQDDKEIKLERQNIIDAVVVRIMKARKTEKHN